MNKLTSDNLYIEEYKCHQVGEHYLSYVKFYFKGVPEEQLKQLEELFDSLTYGGVYDEGLHLVFLADRKYHKKNSKELAEHILEKLKEL